MSKFIYIPDCKTCSDVKDPRGGTEEPCPLTLDGVSVKEWTSEPGKLHPDCPLSSALPKYDLHSVLEKLKDAHSEYFCEASDVFENDDVLNSDVVGILTSLKPDLDAEEEVCDHCGHTAESGACFYCKMD